MLVANKTVAAELNRPQSPLRAALTGSQLVGLAMLRYVIQAEPLASVDTETLVGWRAPAVQRCLTGDAPGPT